MSTSYVEKIKKVENLNENGEDICADYLRGLKKKLLILYIKNIAICASSIQI